MIEFSGIEFRHVDNRLMSMKLVQLGLSGLGDVRSRAAPCCSRRRCSTRRTCWSSAAASARSATSTSTCSAARARASRAISATDGGEIVELMELTMRNLREEGGEVDRGDFLARADMLAASGKTVLISDYFEYYRLAAYLGQVHQAAESPSPWARRACATCSTRSTTTSSRAASSSRSAACSRTTCASTSTRLLDQATGTLVTVDNLEVPPRAPQALRLPGRQRVHPPARERQPRLPAHLLARRAPKDQSWRRVVGADGPRRSRPGHQTTQILRLPPARECRTSCTPLRRELSPKSHDRTPSECSTITFMRAAHRRADGTFEYGGEIYRLDTEGDQFAVRRLSDSKVVGALRFADDRHHAHIEADDPTTEAGAIAAIARLLDDVRGVVPLQ